MIKRMLSLLLSLSLALSLAAWLAPQAQAMTVSAYDPRATISYDYTPDVECGTIRYISQKPDSSTYYPGYWGDWDAASECSTSCISMALSYIGINQTPKDILDYGNGLTYFGRNWGGSVSRIYTYNDLETAVNHYINGEGKYSPPIVHLDKYSGSGHYVLLVGQISENKYQVVDPANTALWNIEINGSTASYPNYSGGVTIDSIDEGGSDVYQWYNPNAVLPGYLSECTTESAYCGIVTNADLAAMSLPCSNGMPTESVQMEVIPKGTELTATRLVLNTLGKYWYRVQTPKGKTAYIPAGQTTYVESYCDDISLHSAQVPDTVKKGGSFAVTGTISATNNILTGVGAKVCVQGDETQTPVLLGEDTQLTKAYFLKGSAVDKSMIFAQLGVGTYTYSIYANYSNSYATSDTTKQTSTGTVYLMNATFKVAYFPEECEHSYTDTLTTPASCLTNGERTFQCSLCGTSYTEPVAPVGHSWQEATCAAPKTCSGCGKTEGESLPHTWQDATCTTAKTCTVCGGTEGAPKGHSYEKGVCTVCQAEDPNYAPPMRLAGESRYDTAFAAADELKKILGGSFRNIVVSSGTGFADALAGSYLASVKNAPILLVRDSNVDDVKRYIQANLSSGGTVYLLGGEKAVPKAMETGMDGFAVKRLGGSDRYETNLMILQEAGIAGKDLIVCTGKKFADSLSASAVGLPILLVRDNLSDEQNAFIQENQGKKIIIGGKSAVSEAVEQQLAAYGSTERIAGAERYETSVLVANRFFSAPTKVVLAYGKNFPDGLSGGPLAYSVKAPMILTQGGKEDAAADYCMRQKISTGYALGGTAVLTDKTINIIFGLK